MIATLDADDTFHAIGASPNDSDRSSRRDRTRERTVERDDLAGVDRGLQHAPRSVEAPGHEAAIDQPRAVGHLRDAERHLGRIARRARIRELQRKAELEFRRGGHRVEHLGADRLVALKQAQRRRDDRRRVGVDRLGQRRDVLADLAERGEQRRERVRGIGRQRRHRLGKILVHLHEHRREPLLHLLRDERGGVALGAEAAHERGRELRRERRRLRQLLPERHVGVHLLLDLAEDQVADLRLRLRARRAAEQQLRECLDGRIVGADFAEQAIDELRARRAPHAQLAHQARGVGKRGVDDRLRGLPQAGHDEARREIGAERALRAVGAMHADRHAAVGRALHGQAKRAAARPAERQVGVDAERRVEIDALREILVDVAPAAAETDRAGQVQVAGQVEREPAQAAAFAVRGNGREIGRDDIEIPRRRESADAFDERAGNRRRRGPLEQCVDLDARRGTGRTRAAAAVERHLERTFDVDLARQCKAQQRVAGRHRQRRIDRRRRPSQHRDLCRRAGGRRERQGHIAGFRRDRLLRVERIGKRRAGRRERARHWQRIAAFAVEQKLAERAVENRGERGVVGFGLGQRGGGGLGERRVLRERAVQIVVQRNERVADADAAALRQRAQRVAERRVRVEIERAAEAVLHDQHDMLLCAHIRAFEK